MHKFRFFPLNVRMEEYLWIGWPQVRNAAQESSANTGPMGPVKDDGVDVAGYD